ncbi:MAG: hypothetical protein BMS9Abin33_0413 [Gammaproteobacteria bacterium]|nr:MAG: hypothetical protein BMS9Abin33_0413 [Gammaproteobacteria bacterium]
MLKSFLNIFAKNILILVFLLGILEIVLRTFMPMYTVGIPETYQYDEKTGYRLKGNIHLFRTLDYQAEIFTNSFGTANFADNFDGYKTLIYAVGDSYTEGSGLPSDASYPFQLDLLLNIEDDYQEKYGVVNLGIGGYSGKQNIIRLRNYVETLGKPDIILYMGSENDQGDDASFDSGMVHNHLVDGSPKWGIFLKPVRWLTNELQLGVRLKLFVRYLRLKVSEGEGATAVQARNTEVSDEQERAQKKLEHNLESHESSAVTSSARESGKTEKEPSVASLQVYNFEELQTISKRLNAALVVGWSDASGESYDWLQTWARQKGVGFADWRPLVKSVQRVMPEIPLVNRHSGGHHRIWVNSLIARAYANEINKLGLQKQQDKID